MTEHNPLALARDLCSRATPYRLLKRVAGLAFNFSSVTVDKEEAPRVEKLVEEKRHRNALRPAFRAL